MDNKTAASLLDWNPQVSGEEIEDLVRGLAGREESEALSADRRLRELTSADVHNLLEWSRSRHANRHAVNSCSGCVVVAFAMFGVLASIIGLSLLLTGADNFPFALLGGLVGLGLAFAIAKSIRGPDTSVESETLARVEDPGVCAPILHAISSMSDEVKKSASKALMRLLPRIKASDSADFPRTARNAIHRMFLSFGTYPIRLELILTAMNSLEQIGDESSRRALE